MVALGFAQAFVGALAFVGFVGACSEPQAHPEALHVTQCAEDVALGAMRERSAVVWARRSLAIDGPVWLHARLGEGPRAREAVARFRTEDDDTAHLRIERPEGAPDDVPLVLWESAQPELEGAPTCAPRTVHFAPPPDAERAVRFAFGGDVGGQNVCRDVTHGFPTLPAFAARDAAHGVDFRVLLGDMVYADETCAPRGALGNAQVPLTTAPTLASFRDHWRYAERDPAYAAMRWGSYVVWDDHETMNDAGPHADSPRGLPELHLLPIGRRAWLEQNALEVPPRDTSSPLLRRVRWGRQLELVMLDTRSHRDDAALRDDGEAPTTMLGAAQRHAVEQLVRDSDARWLVLVSSVPLAIPTGPGPRRDSWATDASNAGHVRELRGLLDVVRRTGRDDVVVVTTDVHFTAAFEHHPFSDAPRFTVHELVTGPLAAGLFPIDRFDRSLGTERLLFHVPEGPVRTLDDARPFFTWGEVAVDEAGALTLEARNADGLVWTRTLAP